MRDRPAFLTEDEHRAFVSEARRVVSCIGEPSEKTVALVAAGIWLGHTVRAAGAEKKASEQLVQAYGQAVAPSREPWATAHAILARWRAGRAPQPGAEWAMELLTGDVSDLPAGGVRLVQRPHA
jgi:hypothetical protein